MMMAQALPDPLRTWRLFPWVLKANIWEHNSQNSLWAKTAFSQVRHLTLLTMCAGYKRPRWNEHFKTLPVLMQLFIQLLYGLDSNFLKRFLARGNQAFKKQKWQRPNHTKKGPLFLSVLLVNLQTSAITQQNVQIVNYLLGFPASFWLQTNIWLQRKGIWKDLVFSAFFPSHNTWISTIWRNLILILAFQS